jgi:hypothetical protein
MDEWIESASRTLAPTAPADHDRFGVRGLPIHLVTEPANATCEGQVRQSTGKDARTAVCISLRAYRGAGAAAG